MVRKKKYIKLKQENDSNILTITQQQAKINMLENMNHYLNILVAQLQEKLDKFGEKI